MSQEALGGNRAVIRTITVCVLSALSFALTIPDAVLPWHPAATYGFGIDKGGGITLVAPGTSAASAGLVTGDQVDLRSAPAELREETNTLYTVAPEPGHRLTFAVRHNGAPRSVTVIAAVQTRSGADNASDEILILSALLFLGIGAALVLLRPSRATWAFFVIALNTGGSSAIGLLHGWPHLAAECFTLGVQPLASIAFIAFAFEFPTPTDRRMQSRFDATVTAAAVVYTGAFLAAIIMPEAIGIPTNGLVKVLQSISAACVVAGLVTLVWKFVRSGAEDRQRIKWVIFGLVVGYGVVVYFMLFVRNQTVVEYNIAHSASVLFPITLAYAVVRHRVIDVNFLVSRTLVYGAITAVIIAMFGVIDWFFNSYLALAKAGTAAEIASAVGLGFWLRALHGRVDTFVDSVFFRRRHEAEVRLLRLAKALPHASTIEAVTEAVVDRAVDALDLTSGALFLKEEGGEFRRLRASGWERGGASSLAADDVLVIQLAADQQPLRLAHADYRRDAMPQGPALPVLAVPVSVRNELRALVLYGPHRRGDDLDPDEVSTLSTLAAGASAALDHAEAERLRKKMDDNAAIAREMEAMRLEISKLRSALAT